MLRRLRTAAFAFGLPAVVLACSSSQGTAGESGLLGGAWYDTTSDGDLSYLPRGRVEVQRAVDLAVEHEGQAFRADAYVPEGKDAAPVVVVLPGAFIEKTRYVWLGETLASHGVLVVVVEPSGGFNKSYHATATLSALARWNDDSTSPLRGRVDLDRVVLAGHSQGALVQAGLVDVPSCAPGFCDEGLVTPRGIRGVLLLGYHAENPDRPDENGGPIGAGDVPWLVLTGSADGLTTPEKAKKTFARLMDRPATLVEIAGMNHFQFTDYVDPETDRALDRDNLPSLGNKEARAIAAEYAVRFVSRTLLGDGDVPDDYGARKDERVRVVVKEPRFRVAAPIAEGRVVGLPLGPAGLDGRAENSDVVAVKEFQGALYLLVRNDVTGAELWRLRNGTMEKVPFSERGLGGFERGARLNGLLGALEVFKDKLYVGVSSGVQGATLTGSVGGEVWSFDGTTFRPVVASRGDDDPEVQVAAVGPCSGAVNELTVEGTLPPGDWAGGVLDNADTTSGIEDLVTLEVVAASGGKLTVRTNAVAGEPATEPEPCAKLEPGSKLRLRKGTDESGFGSPWNKAITAMAVMGGKLFVGTGLNYDAGAELYATEDGETFSVAVPRSFLGKQGEGPISSSITALHVSNVGGSERLYIAANGTGNYGARLFSWALSGLPTAIVDANVDADDRGFDEAGFGRGTSQIASMATFGGRLWVGSFDYNGAEIFSATTLEGPARDWRVEVGDGAAIPRGFGDKEQIIAHVAADASSLRVGTVAYVRRETDLVDTSGLAFRFEASGASGLWSLGSKHAYRLNAVGVTRHVAYDGGWIAVASRGALTSRTSFGGALVYRLVDPGTGARTPTGEVRP